MTPDTTFKELATTLTRERISAVPVVDGTGCPIGVVSEADVLAKQEFHGGTDEKPHGDPAGRDRWFRAKAQTAAELMTTPARTVRADERRRQDPRRSARPQAVCHGLRRQARRRRVPPRPATDLRPDRGRIA